MKINGINFDDPRIREICTRFKVRELSVFGSLMSGEFKANSDVDLLIEFEPETEIGFMDLSRIERELSEVFGRKVDLVPKRGLKPALHAEVLSKATIVYAA